MPKFAVHFLMFNTERWILPAIDNCGEFVDRIYIAYSKYPWTYNKKARKYFLNKDNPEILKKSKYYSKIVLIEGKWDREEDQRNACYEKAKADGIDYFLTQDTDEFYTPAGYQKIKETVLKNPNQAFYFTKWYTFWKSFDYVLLDDQNQKDSSKPEVVLNCHLVKKFKEKRIPDSDGPSMIIDVICFHGSYVLTDEEVFEKIATWGHAQHFDRTLWFLLKWLWWTPQMKYLHPSKPKVWNRAEKYTGELPAQALVIKTEIKYRNFFQCLIRYFELFIRYYLIKK
jgi:hypothetical protein